ncbi:MAG: sodium-dependent transporter [Rhizobiales bacterium]|nr:sodium-dependent transporter [Hyphomicrobiales bacterium]
MQAVSGHAIWSSRFAFLMAAIGSAVGLGNIWRFPYLAGANGGGAFILVYILTIIAIALPILITEILLGRMGKASPIMSMRRLISAHGASGLWSIIGWGGTVGAFFVLSFYSVIGGWAIHYVTYAATGVFAGMNGDQAGALFADLTADPATLIAWHTIFMAVTVFIVAGGVKAGIERAVVILMPLLFLLLLGMAIYATTTAGFGEALRFMFDFRFQDIHPSTVLAAIGQGFFSLSVALGAMMTYGAYVDEKESISSSAIIIAIADTSVAILAGIAIFPLVFTYGLEPGSGPGLTFVTLPIAFGTLGSGIIVGIAFFTLLSVAAITSSISLLEPTVAWAEEKFTLSRVKLSILIGFGAWLLGFLTVFSFNHLAGFHPLAGLGLMKDKTFFDIFDFTTSNIVMPSVGFLMAVFAGWVLSSGVVAKALGAEKAVWFPFWRFLIRYVAPLGVISIFVANVLLPG